MITWTVIAVGILLLAGVVAVLHAAGHAPEGYEDECGFHLGVEPSVTVSSVAAPVPFAEAAELDWIEEIMKAHAPTHTPQRPVGVC